MSFFNLLAVFSMTIINISGEEKSLFDTDPHLVREFINNKIMAVEAETPSVFQVKEAIVNREGRSTPLRIYIPSQDKNLPVVLMIHGGGWVAGNLDTHDNMARYLCRGANAVVFSVGYLNAPEGKFPLPLEQCYDALLWINEHAKDYSVNANRLAVIGESAGGNLSAALCLLARDRQGPKIYLQVLINPSPDLTGRGTLKPQGDIFDPLRWFAWQYVSKPEDVYNPYVSPTLAPDLSELPKARIILAEKDDTHIKEGEIYAEKLAQANVPTKTYVQLGIGHLAGDAARASKKAEESLNVAVEALRDL